MSKSNTRDTTDTISENPEKTVIVSCVSTRYQEFPLSVFPEPVRTYISEAATSIGVDPAFVALPMLSSLATAVGLGFWIELKRGWREPAVIWTCTVASSGTGKSPALKAALDSLERHEQREIQKYEADLATYAHDKLQFEKDIVEWKRHKGGEPPIEPSPPICKRNIVNDITVESLCAKSKENPRGLLNVCDEFSSVISSFSRYKGKSGGSDCHNYLSMFNAGSLRVDRKTGETKFLYIPHAAISMTGGVQPKTLSRCLTAEYRDNGFAARLLMAAPPRQPRRWTEDEISASATKAVNQLFDNLLRLTANYDVQGNIIQTDIPLCPAAKKVFIRFFNEHAQEQYSETSGELTALWSKLEGYAPRFALIFHMTRVAAGDASLTDFDSISVQDIQNGIDLARWFGQEGRRVYALLSETEEEAETRELVETIERLGGKVSSRDLMRANTKFKTADDASLAMNELAKKKIGYLHTVTHDGRGRTGTVFRLHLPLTTDTISENPEKTRIVSVKPSNYENAFATFEGEANEPTQEWDIDDINAELLTLADE